MDELKRVKVLAYRKLGRQALSSHQLREKLLFAKCDEALVTLVIDELLSLGYLDDKAWGATLVQGEMRKKKSVSQVVGKLRSLGVSHEEALDLVEKYYPEESEGEHLTILIEKAKRLNKDPKKMIASLMRKGFCYEDIVKQL